MRRKKRKDEKTAFSWILFNAKTFKLFLILKDEKKKNNIFLNFRIKSYKQKKRLRKDFFRKIRFFFSNKGKYFIAFLYVNLLSTKKYVYVSISYFCRHLNKIFL